MLIAPTGGVGVTAGTLVDGLAGVVALMVGVVALLVQVYSVEYLRDGHRATPRTRPQVSLFTAAMLAVVLSADLLALLVGWEVMGLCSYLLIGHYRDAAGGAGAPRSRRSWSPGSATSASCSASCCSASRPARSGSRTCSRRAGARPAAR